MKSLINLRAGAMMLMLILLSGTSAWADVDDYVLSVRNVTHTTNTIDFDLYLLDADNAQTFEFAALQMGLVLNSSIYGAGVLTVSYSNAVSGLDPDQLFVNSPDLVAPLAGNDGKTLIRLMANSIPPVPPGAGSGTEISSVGNGTLLAHFTITSSVSFTPNSRAGLEFCVGNAVSPLYPTVVYSYIEGNSTALPVTPGVDAIVDGDPLLNPTLPAVFNVTGTGTYCQGGSGLPVSLSGSELNTTYDLFMDGDLVTTLPGTGSALTFINQTEGTYTVFATNAAGTVQMTGQAVITAIVNIASAPSTTPTLCINTALTAITHATTGATGIGTPSNLPAGVSAAWASNTITITGTPTASGTFTYSIPLTGGCGSVNATGTITVTATNTVGAASSTPTLCINSALTPITHATTGATGIGTSAGLPAGVSANWAGNTITISGTPTASGTFNYSIPLTGGCATINATGTINVNALPVTSVITGSATPACSATGVPYSVTSTAGSTYTWTVPAGATVATGQGTNSITVNFGTTNGNVAVTERNTAGCNGTPRTLSISLQGCGLSADFGANPRSVCVGSAVLFTNLSTGTSGSTAYSWNFGSGASPLTATGPGPHSVTYSTSGSKDVSLTITDGASDVETKLGYITVNPTNTITRTSAVGTDNQTVCVNTAISNITYSTTGATGATFLGLPAGVNANWSANLVTISGTPTIAGTYNYTVTLTGGCGNGTANGTINVNVCTKTLNLILFLEALYNGSNGLIKVQDCDDGENSFDIFPGLISDTMTVELALATSPYTTVYSQHGVPINTNGTITLTSVPGGLSGNYHIVIKHRNHIETWSQVTSFAGSTVNYNFTDAISKAWANNMVLTGAVYCIYGGDANRDQYVDGFDLASTFNNNRLGSFGYQLPDINGDGFVDGFDLARVFNNNRKGVGMNTPLAPLKKK